MPKDLDRKTKAQINKLKRVAKKSTPSKRSGTKVESELKEKNRTKDRKGGSGWRDLF